MAYAIMSVLKYHTFAQIKGQQQHNNREIPMPHIDGSKSIENRLLVDPGGNYSEAWARRIDEAEIEFNQKINVRRNAVKAIEFVLTFSPDADINVRKWSEENIKWLKERFGEKNVIAATLHMDETTPHIHATVVPINDKGRLSAKSFIDGPGSLYKLQTSYADAMKQFNLFRGEKNSKTKKRNLEKFYSALNDIEENPAPLPFQDEDKDDYIDRLTDYIKTMKYAMQNLSLQAERTEEIIDTRVANKLFDYRDAINFYNTLAKEKDEKAAKERLRAYRNFEKNIPESELNKIINFLNEKFPGKDDDYDLDGSQRKDSKRA